jgi:hypothetical protein
MITDAEETMNHNSRLIFNLHVSLSDSAIRYVLRPHEVSSKITLVPIRMGSMGVPLNPSPARPKLDPSEVPSPG